jgi:hypothetical protein
MARRPAHRVGLFALGSENDRAHRIDDHLEKGDVKRPERQRQIEQQRYQSEADDRYMEI